MMNKTLVGPFNTLEAMLAESSTSMHESDQISDQKNIAYHIPPPLPRRPTSKARLPSSYSTQIVHKSVSNSSDDLNIVSDLNIHPHTLKASDDINVSSHDHVDLNLISNNSIHSNLTANNLIMTQPFDELNNLKPPNLGTFKLNPFDVNNSQCLDDERSDYLTDRNYIAKDLDNLELHHNYHPHHQMSNFDRPSTMETDQVLEDDNLSLNFELKDQTDEFCSELQSHKFDSDGDKDKDEDEDEDDYEDEDEDEDEDEVTEVQSATLDQNDQLQHKSGGLPMDKIDVEATLDHCKRSGATSVMILEKPKRERMGIKRWKDALSGLRKNSRVWCLNAENEWTLGVVESTNKEESIISTTDVKPQSKSYPRFIKLPSSKVRPANPVILEGVDDLIQLSYLNEPSVLHNLRHRYISDKIYTRAGPVLIAINPFKKVPLYSKDLLQLYTNKVTDGLDPHVYMTAESAFRAMIRDGTNQSIIISGESGAGKTETAKIAMQYLTAVGGGGAIENEILQTNPILEAFGNAKTSRNNNSSRFGKLTEIWFDSGKISGAKILTYLLEKSRVVQQAKGERSYHIFYQLCAGADDTLRERTSLKTAKDYHYLNQSGCMEIENVDDAAQFREVVDAMNIVKINKQDQENAFTMVAAVLWLGNITFSEIDNDNHVSVNDDEAVRTAAKLLKCSRENLVDALQTRKIHAGNEMIIQELTYAQAADSRDALAKAIYAELFDWLVERINNSFESGKHHTGRSITILDIYGFESFVNNSFEQLCINYANERLQQYFNRHLFKLEQEEYISEGIDWTHIKFEDNQECLDLIEKRPLGLISLLDEECTFPKGTDQTLAEKLKVHLDLNSCFTGERSRGFRIKHYAGEVIYDTLGFLEKNRDLLHSDLLHLLSSCEASMPRVFATRIEQASIQKTMRSHRRKPAESQKQTVATKFKGQLQKLMQWLESTEPHFVRCIKPNTLQQANLYQDDLVLQQLRCCGVLEIVRISKAGYPTRVSHQSFAGKYGFLLPLNLSRQDDTLSTCLAILKQFNIPLDMYQVGYTKLFFRAGQVGRLEECRLKTLNGIICFQKLYRGYKARCYFKKLRKTAIFLQSLVRTNRIRRLFNEALVRHRAAVRIQKYVRCRAQRKAYLKKRKDIVLIQSVARGWLARRKTSALRVKLEKERQKLLALQRFEEEKQKARELELKHFEEEKHKAVELESTRLNEEKQKAVESKRDMVVSAINGFSLDSTTLEVLNVAKGFLTTTEAPNLESNTTIAVSSLFLAELQSRVLMVESALREKEEDNAILRRRLNQYEEMWEKAASFQASAEKRGGIASAGDVVAHASGHYDAAAFSFKNSVIATTENEEDDFSHDDTISVGTVTTPGYSMTPSRQESPHALVNAMTAVFEHRRQAFEDDLNFLVDVKSEKLEATTIDPEDELRNLKERFEFWRKDFRARLRDTKGTLRKLRTVDAHRMKMTFGWWGKKA